MKFTTDRPFANPDLAARKLVEIANGIEAVQDVRQPQPTQLSTKPRRLEDVQEALEDGPALRSTGSASTAARRFARYCALPAANFAPPTTVSAPP
jgi:hypothetical protein